VYQCKTVWTAVRLIHHMLPSVCNLCRRCCPSCGGCVGGGEGAECVELDLERSLQEHGLTEEHQACKTAETLGLTNTVEPIRMRHLPLLGPSASLPVWGSPHVCNQACFVATTACVPQHACVP
jgi:hypothetical protein